MALIGRLEGVEDRELALAVEPAIRLRSWRCTRVSCRAKNGADMLYLVSVRLPLSMKSGKGLDGLFW